MTYPATNLNEAVGLIVPDSNALHNIINGDADSTITTPKGREVPTVLKAMADSVLFKNPIPWEEGGLEQDPLQLRTFTDGLIYWSPTAQAATPVAMGASPIGDSNWKISPIIKSHNSLTNRDESGAHPASAIDGIERGLEQAIGLDARVWPKTGSVSVGDVIPAPQGGRPITHISVEGNLYSMTPIANGTVTNLTLDSAVIGGITVALSEWSLQSVYSKTLESESGLSAAIKSLESKEVILRPIHKSNAANFVNGKKGCVVLGDSISHGAFAGDLYSHGYVRLLSRAYNARFGGSSYGYIPLLNLGTGATLSRDLHNVAFINNAAGGWVATTSAQGIDYLTGLAFKSVGANNVITITIPSFMRRAVVHYNKEVGGGAFAVSVNGTQVAVIDTNGERDSFATVEVAANDNQYGATIISITTQSVSPVTIMGVSWFSSSLEPVMQNFSQSGRRVLFLSNSVITKVCENAQSLVFALGHNDYAESDGAYISSVTNTINFMISEATRCGVNIIVPDFCWSAPTDNWMRKLLKRLATETNGAYVDFPSLLANPDGSPASADRLINQLRLFTDGSHPNQDGNEYIFSEIAKAMGLISSKKDVLSNHDYWLSLQLDANAEVENAVPALPSSAKRTPAGILLRLFIEHHPTGAFPIGSYVITTAYPPRSSIVGVQTAVHPIMRLDGQAVIGGITVGAGGEITLNVTEPSVYNDIVFNGIA